MGEKWLKGLGVGRRVWARRPLVVVSESRLSEKCLLRVLYEVRRQTVVVR